MNSRDFTSTLDIATPERVALDLPIAGLGYRSLAYLLDFFVLFIGWTALFFALTLLNTDLLGRFRALSGLAQTLFAVSAFAAQWLFWTLLEGLGGGRTVGKRVLHIRVVRDDGSPIGIFEAAVRNLTRLIDFMPSFYGVGVLAMLFSRENRRVGDWLAGTVVIRDVEADLDRYQVAGPLPAEGPSSLAVGDVELILDFLKRGEQLDPAHRTTLSERLLARYRPELDASERKAVAADWPRAQELLRTLSRGER